MRKTAKLFCVSFVIVCAAVIIGCEKTDHSGHNHSAQAEEQVEDGKENIEQTHCPVMKGPINKEYFVEYKNKKVYFCCPGCEEEFNKDPEKYTAELPQFK